MSNHPNRNAVKLIVYSRDNGGLLTRHVIDGLTQQQHQAEYSIGDVTDVERLRGWPEDLVRWHGHIGYATTVAFMAAEAQAGGGTTGWTVLRREGSRRAGYADYPTDAARTLTLHQAQATADAFTRDFARHGLLHDSVWFAHSTNEAAAAEGTVLYMRPAAGGRVALAQAVHGEPDPDVDTDGLTSAPLAKPPA